MYLFKLFVNGKDDTLYHAVVAGPSFRGALRPRGVKQVMENIRHIKMRSWLIGFIVGLAIGHFATLYFTLIPAK